MAVSIQLFKRYEPLYQAYQNKIKSCHTVRKNENRDGIYVDGLGSTSVLRTIYDDLPPETLHFNTPRDGKAPKFVCDDILDPLSIRAGIPAQNASVAHVRRRHLVAGLRNLGAGARFTAANAALVAGTCIGGTLVGSVCLGVAALDALRPATRCFRDLETHRWTLRASLFRRPA